MINDSKKSTSWAGTINEETFLTDETGNRRFWVFEGDYADFEKLTDELVEKAHIQAYRLWKEGYICYLLKQENDKLNERNIKYSLSSREEELLFECYDLVSEGSTETGGWFSISEIIKRFEAAEKYRSTSNSHVMIGKALKKHNVPQKRDKKARKYLLRDNQLWAMKVTVVTVDDSGTVTLCHPVPGSQEHFRVTSRGTSEG